MRSASQPWLTVATVVLVVGSSRALAGPSFDLDTKALYARAIIEAEITVLPKSAGWKAASARAKEQVVLRTIFRDRDFDSKRTPPYFPFSMSSRCWARMEGEKKIRVLAFYPDETVAGLEEDSGAYSALNADFDRLVEAIATVSEWRRAPRGATASRKHLAVVSETSNPYLRFIGAHFVKEYDRSAEPQMEEIIKKTPSSVSYPVADCDRQGKRANPALNPTGLRPAG